MCSRNTNSLLLTSRLRSIVFLSVMLTIKRNSSEQSPPSIDVGQTCWRLCLTIHRHCAQIAPRGPVGHVQLRWDSPYPNGYAVTGGGMPICTCNGCQTRSILLLMSVRCRGVKEMVEMEDVNVDKQAREADQGHEGSQRFALVDTFRLTMSPRV
jgi:hypothetical protein